MRRCGVPIGTVPTPKKDGAHDLVGADHVLPDMQADTLIADKAFDADERVPAFLRLSLMASPDRSA